MLIRPRPAENGPGTVLALLRNPMKRPLLVLLMVALAVGGAMAWTTLQRDREYQRLLAAGEAALAADQTLGAIEAFSGAIALKNDSMAGWLKRGETYHIHGDLTAAVRDLQTAATLDPSATRPLELLGDVNYSQERYRRAAERYEAYLRLDDQSPRLLYKLALAHYRDGRVAGAIVPLRRAVQLSDRFAEAYHLLGLALQKQRQTREAAAAYRQAVTVNPALVPAREALADLYASTGRHAARLEQLEALAALDTERPERLIALGLAQADAGRVDLAVASLGRAAERRPGTPLIYSALAGVWLRLAERGDEAALGKALEASRLGLASGTRDSHDLLLHGRALLLAGRTDAALRILRDATRQLPVDENAYLHLADAAQQLGRAAEARRALLSYLTLTDDDRRIAASASRIAELSLRLRDAPAAVRWLSRAIRLLPDDAMLHARLAEAHLAAGDPDAARQALDRALAHGAGETTPLLRRLASQLEKP